MVDVVGFTDQEREVITGMMARFHATSHRLGELKRIAKADMPGYNGKVVPRRVGSMGLEMDMFLSSCSPFTVAHELAHVSDITCRRRETMDNLSLEMPTSWHLAHRMSSEYFANRIACDYAEEGHIFEAFQSDHTGFKVAAVESDWASFLIYYSLMLGIFHGMSRMDKDPLDLLRGQALPEAVTRGIENFRTQAHDFFAGHAHSSALA